MTIDTIPQYNKKVHPMNAWYPWYSKNEVEITIFQKEMQELNRIANMGHRIGVERLSGMRYIHEYKYTDMLRLQHRWSPLLTSREKMEFDDQIIRFYKENKENREAPRPYPQPLSVGNNSVSSIGVMDFIRTVDGTITEVDSQPATTNPQPNIYQHIDLSIPTTNPQPNIYQHIDPLIPTTSMQLFDQPRSTGSISSMTATNNKSINPEPSIPTTGMHLFDPFDQPRSTSISSMTAANYNSTCINPRATLFPAQSDIDDLGGEIMY